MIRAEKTTAGQAYRPTRASSVEPYRGYSVLVRVLPREERKVFAKLRSNAATGRDAFTLSMMGDGAVLFWRYFRDRRELAALPSSYRLRKVAAPAWLPKTRAA